MPLLKEQEPRTLKTHYTYADTLEWDESFRAELINGEICPKYGEVNAMSGPSTMHQRISMRLSIKIGSFLEEKPCEVFAAPYAVRLFPEPDLNDATVLEPDLLVICDPAKLDERSCNGAPDLVIEILSPTSSRNDLLRKFNLYLEAGVREYWLIDPENQLIAVHVLENGHYRSTTYDAKTAALAPVTVLPGLHIDLKALFA